MGLYEDLNRAGLLAIGLTPEWVDLTAYTGAPASPSSGAYLQGSPRAMLYVAAREDVQYRTGRVQITTTDLAATYTITVDGTAVVYDAAAEAPADLDALVAGIAAAIEADGTATLVVDALTDPDAADTVLITGKAEADWSLDATATGSAVLAATADAADLDLRVWVTPGGLIKSGSTGNAGGWVQPVDAAYSGLGYRGAVERLDVAGLDRLYLEAYNVAGHASDGSAVQPQLARVMVGPTVLEAT